MIRSTTSPRDSGFAGQVSAASLAELVQYECSRRADSAYVINSSHGVGSLFFAQGEIVHAETSLARGDQAVLEMLTWAGGRFSPATGRWSQPSTVQESHQGLLLRAAQIADESTLQPTYDSPLDSPPDSPLDLFEELGDADIELFQDEASATGPRSELIETKTALASEKETEKMDHQVIHAKILRSGEVVETMGNADALVDVVAYSVQLGDAIGADLGLEGLESIDCSTEDGQLLVAIRSDALYFYQTESTSVQQQLRQKLEI
ncbi:MAG: DUF4388 domain-containing protein [Polyangiaceae bacterium]|nr:DUF4388 domain-containing protein [Polyangiaceae bacterium]